MTQPGKVYLVGAGPGDPDLITVKGLKILRQAEVVIYDRLIPHSLLDEAPPHAERINAGKLPQKHRLPQEEINAVILERAKRGLMVVRLKGGDPFVFGRGGEEMLACYEAGIPCEVVSGVTSAIAVPAAVGIPVTQRLMSSAFTVFTGHEDPNKPETSIDYTALAAAARLGTLVLLMGVARLEGITEKLIAAGIDPLTPVACIEWGTTPEQRQIRGTLASIATLAQENSLSSPVTTVIGAVVGLSPFF